MMETYKLELDVNDLRELELALQERPYKSVAALIAKIGQQISSRPAQEKEESQD